MSEKIQAQPPEKHTGLKLTKPKKVAEGVCCHSERSRGI